LPNLLLFGADTLGPDLTRAFEELIQPSRSRMLYAELCASAAVQFRQEGRKFRHVRERVALWRAGYNLPEVIHVGPYLPYSRPDSYHEGDVLIEYDGQKMPTMIPGGGDELFPAPPVSAINGIYLVWPEDFGIAPENNEVQ
jgi:hypothetical protein